jgi:peptide/nickel transport system substrate-binding protein
MSPLVEPYWWIPWNPTYGFAPLYAIWWNSGGANGEEPTAAIKKTIDLWEKALTATSEADRLKFGKELLAYDADQLFTIGTVGQLPAIGVKSNKMANVPDFALSDWLLRTPMNAHPEQFYFKE